MTSISIEDKEKIDVESWAKGANRGKQDDFLEYKINRMTSAGLFLRKLRQYQGIFQRSNTILELGGGSCWASYIVKKKYPDAVVVGTDLVDSAIENQTMWEPVFNTQIDEAYVCRAYETPFADQSFDLIFCFEAAHHFGRHYRTIDEIKRVLKPNGTCLYLYEPACQPYIHPLAYRRVNALRESVKEDVLIYRKLIKKCESIGLSAEVIFDPSPVLRGPKQTLYYATLSLVPALQHVLPCCIDMKIQKNE